MKKLFTKFLESGRAAKPFLKASLVCLFVLLSFTAMAERILPKDRLANVNGKGRLKMFEHVKHCYNGPQAYFGFMPAYVDNKPMVVKVMALPFSTHCPSSTYGNCEEGIKKAWAVNISTFVGITYFDGEHWHLGKQLKFNYLDFNGVLSKLQLYTGYKLSTRTNYYMFMNFKDAWRMARGQICN